MSIRRHKHPYPFSIAIGGPLVLILSSSLTAATVSTAQNDLNRTGANTSEIILTPANVSKMGLLRTCPVTGYSYAQVLFLPAVNGHDLAIAATMNNDLYAFDVNTCSQIWHTNLGSVWTNYGTCCSGNLTFYGQPMGIVTTPVVNTSTGKLFVINSTPTPSQVLNRLNLTTGAVEASVTISGTYSTATFSTSNNFQVGALALSPDGTKVYATFGGWENGQTPYQGWIMGYDTSSLSQIGIFCTTVSGQGANPWQSRAAPAIDASGNVYVLTGNGDYDGSSNFGQSMLKFSSTLSLLDWFTPSNHAATTAVDADFAADRVILIPGTSPQLALGAGKDFTVYVVDTTCMGHLQGSSACNLQTFPTLTGTSPAAFTGSFGSLFLNNTLYLPLTTGPLYSFSFSGSSFNTTPVFVTMSAFGSHNGQVSGSSNGASNGLIWVTTSSGSSFTSKQPGTLRALNASTGAQVWSYAYGTLSKFASPTIANGLVIVPSLDGQIDIFGLMPSSQITGQAQISGQATIQ